MYKSFVPIQWVVGVLTNLSCEMLVMSKYMFCLIYFDVIITTVGTLY